VPTVLTPTPDIREEAFMQIRQNRRHFLANLSAAGVAAVLVSRDSLADGGRSDPGSITIGNFWTPFLFPEMVSFAFMQEDLSEGAVNSWVSRGVKPKTATGIATKLSASNGVQFAKGTTQSLSWGADTDSQNLNRWGVAIARVDLNANPGAGSAGELMPLNIHGNPGNLFHRQPRLLFFNDGDFHIQIHDGQSFTSLKDAQLGNNTWNVIFWHNRGWQLHGWINGVKQTPIPFKGWAPNNTKAQSWIGGGGATLSANLTVDCVIAGQSELNDAQIDKLVGWAHWRVGRQDLLPSDHPYKNAAPTGDPDPNDNPTRYVHNSATWDAWAAVPSDTRYRGNPPPALDDGQGNDYKRVFFDDFITNTIVDGVMGAPTDSWYSPTHLVGINADAKALSSAASPDCYPHDPVNHTITLRMQETAPSNGQWRSGAFSSVNQSGKGRWWSKAGSVFAAGSRSSLRRGRAFGLASGPTARSTFTGARATA